MRTAARRPTTNPDAMDAAYDLGLERARAAQLEQELARLRTKQRGGFLASLWTIIVLVGSVVVGLLIYERLPLPGAAPLPTAVVGRPTYVPGPTSDYGVGAYNEAQRRRAAEQDGAAALPTPLYSGDAREMVTPAQLAPEAHTTDPFWTDAELAAFTATAVAFMDPGTLPTPEPAFVEYVATQCADADLVAKSKTLQMWCSTAVAGED